MPLDVDRSIVGQEFDRTHNEPVTAEHLIAFSKALGETAPCYTEPGPDLIAHPTYCTRYRGRQFFPPNLPKELLSKRSLDAGKDIELGEPIRPGDVLTVSTCVHEIYEKTGRTGSMNFLVVRGTITNQDGAHVATIDSRHMFR
jgi:acyl dehydratase